MIPGFFLFMLTEAVRKHFLEKDRKMERNTMEKENKKDTKLCKHCKTEIPKDAKVCPNCRKKQKGIGKWIAIAVVVVILIAAMSGGEDNPKKVETADAEIKASGIDLKYEVGTMIEIPRAALTADEIASEADFFSFGTNDLTQMTFGFSRDDAGKFLNAYYDAKIYESDPFAKVDQKGVGKLMKMAIDLGRPVNPKLHIGVCGEHGGDPSSVEFFNKIGLDYVSCSPFRVPIARLAAAQAAIANR